MKKEINGRMCEIFVVEMTVERWDSVARQFFPHSKRFIQVRRTGPYWKQVDGLTDYRFYADGTQTSSSKGVAAYFRRRIAVPEKSANSGLTA